MTATVAAAPLARQPAARTVLAFAGTLAVGFAAFVLLIGAGSSWLAPLDVIATLVGHPPDTVHQQIVWQLRMPRALVGMTAGLMLGLAGALLQIVMRNPLASPGLSGVSAGAILTAVIWTAVSPAALRSGPAFAFVAMIGGGGAAALTYSLAWRRGSHPVRLALAGIIVSAVLQAMTSIVLTLDQENLGAVLLWLIGSLNGRVWVHATTVLLWASVAVPLALLTAGAANLLQLGDEVAAGLGLPVERARAILLLAAIALTAGAVSVVGAVGFIGLFGPHMARRMVGSDERVHLPLSGLVTATLLMSADVVAQLISAEWPFTSARFGLPVGAVTAALGVPFFLYLLPRSKQ